MLSLVESGKWEISLKWEADFPVLPTYCSARLSRFSVDFSKWSAAEVGSSDFFGVRRWDLTLAEQLHTPLDTRHTFGGDGDRRDV